MSESCSKAWVRGYNACVRQQGVTTDNPYTLLENVVEYYEWRDGYYEAETDAIIGD